jgi:predicted dehydrogenase
VWDDLNPLQRVTVYDRGVDLVRARDAKAEDRTNAFVSYRTGDLVSPTLTEREALASMVEEFADCIRTGRASVTDGQSGLRVLDILEAASLSMERHGMPVPLPGSRADRTAAALTP